MKNVLATGMVAALIVGATASAHAQMEQLDRPFRVNVGVFYPSDNDVTDTVGDSHFNFGLSYDLWGGIYSGRTYRGGLFFDASFKDRDGASFNTSALGAFGRLSLGNGSNQSWTPYVGAGLGIFFIDADAPAQSEALTSFSPFKGGSRMGLKLFAGVEATQGYFAELGYRFVGSDNGANGSGLSLSVGFRF